MVLKIGLSDVQGVLTIFNSEIALPRSGCASVTDSDTNSRVVIVMIYLVNTELCSDYSELTF